MRLLLSLVLIFLSFESVRVVLVCCGVQAVVGSVPLTKVSSLVLGQLGQVSVLVIVQMGTLIIFWGRSKD